MPVQPIQTISIRRAVEADRPVVDRLATIDSQPHLSGDVLLAEVEGEVWAAVELASGRTVADPLRPSVAAARLARERATPLSRDRRPRRRPARRRLHVHFA
jgi:hypothetical protein